MLKINSKNGFMGENRVDIMAILKGFWADESAQAMVEYAILAALLVAASYGAIKIFGAAWQKKFKTTSTMRAEAFGVGP